jgi:hypothetical protein
MSRTTMRGNAATLVMGIGLWWACQTVSLAAGYQMKISFSGYTGRSETLANFPVLVVLSNNVAGSGFSYGTMLSGQGYDLRFVTNLTQTTSLNYEIESWNSSGTSYVWVRVPTLPPNGLGEIWAKWGNVADSGQLPCTTNGATWANGYVGVWHMGAANGSGKIPDSVAAPTHGVNYNTTLYSAGKVGAARSFNGTTACIDIKGISKSSGPLSIEYWFRTSDTSHQMMGTDWESVRTSTLVNYPNAGQTTYSHNGSNMSSMGSGLNNGVWHHLAFSLKAGAPHVYIDSQLANVPGLSFTDSIIDGAKAAAIGRRHTAAANSYFFYGELDEVRVSALARSADWVWASHRTMHAPISFSAYGAALESGSGKPTIENGAELDIPATSAKLSGTLTASGDTAARVYLFCATNDYANNAAAWTAGGSATNFGPFSAAATFTNTVSGLTLGTTYYWTYMASNAAGVAWATTGSSPSFRTAGPPVVNNASGATSIGKTFATLNGNLVQASPPATVGIALWADGTTATNTYNFSGSRGAGTSFSTNVTGLVSGTLYHYRCFASNSYGTTWAGTIANFTAYAPGVPTSGDVTWSGAAVGPDWDYDSNWLGGVAPANPTAATVTYGAGGQAVVGYLEADRQIGGLNFNADCAHSLNLGGRGLTLAGNLTGADYCAWSFRVTNGTLRLGTAGTAANLTIGRMDSATLTLSPGTILDPVNVGRVSLGEHNSSGNGQGLLDLRGCPVSGRTLRMRSLSLVGYWYGSYVYLNGSTGIDAIEISSTLSLGDSWAPGTYLSDDLDTYVGNPADGGRLPPNVSLTIGTSDAQRGNLVVNRLSTSSYSGVRIDKIVASAGGVFTAHLTNLWVSANGANAGTALQHGALDVSRMAACSVDARNITIGSPTSPLATDVVRGEVRLCPGTVTAGQVAVGATTGQGFGLLELSNTVVTVSEALSIRATGDVVARQGSASGGITVEADAGGLVIAAGATLTLRFQQPAMALPHYGLRWKGNHVTELEDMAADGRLVIDDAGLGKDATLFVSGGYTCVGLANASGTVIILW